MCAFGPHSAENGWKIQKKKRLEEIGVRHALIQCIIIIIVIVISRSNPFFPVVCFSLSRVLRTTATHKIKTNELYVMQKERSFLIAKSHGEKQNKTKKK